MDKAEKRLVWGLIGSNAVGIFLVILFVLVMIGALFPDSAPANENNAVVGNCTSADIPSGALENINKNMSVYQSAAEKTNVPWEAIAAIHFRETNNSRVTPTSNTDDGVYQVVSKNYTYPAGQNLSDEAFLLETVDAANFLNGKVGNKLTEAMTDAALIKDAFWGYNGREYGSADNSPYVMNNFDADHMNMQWSYIDPKTGKRIYVDDARNGAYTTFVILKGNCK